MNTSLTTTSAPGAIAPDQERLRIDPERLRANFRHFKAKRRSANTLRAYASQWRQFVAWCGVNRMQALPASAATVGAYLEQLYTDRKKVTTLGVACSAISFYHSEARQPDPLQDAELGDLIGGMRRAMAEEGLADRTVKPTISLDDLRALSAACGDSLRGKRDRAIILVAFAGWMRRGEPLKLTAERIEWRDDVAVIRLGVTKTDQDGTRNEYVTIPRLVDAQRDVCGFTALREWVDASGISSGPVFVKFTRGVQTMLAVTDVGYVNYLVGKLADSAGIPRDRISPHRAFRASPITLAFEHGENAADVMKRARHRKMDTTLKYFEEKDGRNAALGRRVYEEKV